ncbi:serine/threonine protein phosphatase [Algicella marina]|uniref:Serine/threonine protein phosphatase n=1 Tax=Algicella marina TaxID=2683284 RepID=A0A6P1T9C4_9RHOB|nr:serine/threonine protein phosphatase [Algicella marina]
MYAIGDIHGSIDELGSLWANIQADLSARPHDAPLVVFLGDYTDRGRDSRGVVEQLIAWRDDTALETRFIYGNHDHCFLTYLSEPLTKSTPTLHWLNPRMGGDKTLASYGIADCSDEDPLAAHPAFTAAVPRQHVTFLRTAERMIRVGSYLFVHAGIRPNVPLPEQEETDLIWIRAPFLDDKTDHGFIVVHGHTPVKEVEHHGNRIAVDTGAVFGGLLSAVVLEDNSASVLDARGLRQLS